jgi:DNA-binding CsgD family transcriptional regulator/tetratricopeptide (TPR) repeat protein
MSPASQPGILIGRDTELAFLRARLDEAFLGRPSVVLVGGDAGIGKTRLLSELAANAQVRVLSGGCLPMGEQGLPFVPIIEIVRSIDTAEMGSGRPALQSLLPPTGETTAGGAISRAQLFQAVVDLFDEIASRSPLLIVIEDLHWADRSTMDLISFVIALLNEQRILVAVSFRYAELHSDHPVRSLLSEWSRRPKVHRLDLEALSSEQSTRLVVNRLLDASPDRDEIQRLVSRAGGNPYFLEELTAAGEVRSAIPGGLKDLLLRRVEGLSQDGLTLLRVASLGPWDIDEQLLVGVSGLPEDEVRALLRSAVDARLLTVEGGRCRFRHALLAEALSEDLLPGHRREYHAAYAGLLVDREPPPTPAEMATHQTGAGDHAAGLVSWIEAAHSAESQFAFAEARLAYSTALDLWDSVPQPSLLVALTKDDVRRRSAEMAFMAGDVDAACSIARDLIADLDPIADPVASGLVHHRLGRYLCNTSHYNDALAVQERAVELVPESPPTSDRAEVVAGLSWVLQYQGRYREARDRAIEALALAAATGAAHAAISAQNTLGNVDCVLEGLDLGLREMRDAMERARVSGDPFEEMRGFWNIWANLLYAGRWHDALDAYQELVLALPRLGFAYEMPEVMVRTAQALMQLGRWDEAVSMVEDARHMDPARADTLGLAQVLIARGEITAARQLIEARSSLAVAGEAEMHLWNDVDLAEVEVADGNQMGAIELVDRVLERSKGLDLQMAAGHALAIGIRSAADNAETARFREDRATEATALATGSRYHQQMAGLAESPGPSDGWKALVRALASQADAELARLEGNSDPDAWRRAATEWDSLSMPYQAAWCMVRWVEASLPGADRDLLAAEIQDLRLVAASLDAPTLNEGVSRLARRGRFDSSNLTTSRGFGLTPREEEVLDLLARGSTNRQIAAELFISEKTAGVHVSNILPKLGASNRGEAVARAIREGLVDLSDHRK